MRHRVGSRREFFGRTKAPAESRSVVARRTEVNGRVSLYGGPRLRRDDSCGVERCTWAALDAFEGEVRAIVKRSAPKALRARYAPKPLKTRGAKTQ
ncbi:MAG: hypothetical protein EOO77_02290 [Oxalobacteraceae bacterium]|nr:MAG: hypothetical protein EOO77_02290 [Oxalobacteraceae bacterium]